MFTKISVNPTWALGKIGHHLSGMSTQAKQEVGIEFELEGINIGADSTVVQELCQPGMRWTYHEDGTLKKNYSGEYVLSNPLSRTEAKQAVSELYAHINAKSKLELSHRCSTHVHMNFQHMNVNQVYLYLVLYYIFEEAFFKVFAPEREGNQFCLSAYNATGIVDNLIKNLIAGKFYSGMDQTSKYAAMNFASLSYHGTLEARLMGGCDDPEKFYKWLDILMELYDYVKDNPKLTPEYFLGQFSGKGFMIFTQLELPKTYQAISSIPNISKMVSNGIFIAQDIAFAVDWSSVIEATEPKKVRRSDPSAYIEAGHPSNEWASVEWSNIPPMNTSNLHITGTQYYATA